MKTSELRELSDTELEEKHGQLKEELFSLRFQMVTGQLDNYTMLKRVRRDVARVLTIQQERAHRSAAEVETP